MKMMERFVLAYCKEMLILYKKLHKNIVITFSPSLDHIHSSYINSFYRSV